MRNIIVCGDGYCGVDYEGKVCCATCVDKTECEKRCELVNDNPSLQLCKHQQSVKMDELNSFKPKGREGLRHNTVCCSCGEPLSESEEDDFKYDDAHYCESCYYETFDTCGYCGETTYQEGMRWVSYRDYSICEICYDNNFSSCSECDEIFHTDETRVNAHGDIVCDWCWERLYTTCENCNEGWRSEDIKVTDIEAAILCPSCWSDMIATCEVCGKTGYSENMHEHGDYSSLCNGCYEDALEPEEDEGEEEIE